MSGRKKPTPRTRIRHIVSGIAGAMSGIGTFAVGFQLIGLTASWFPPDMRNGITRAVLIVLAVSLGVVVALFTAEVTDRLFRSVWLKPPQDN